MSASFKQLQNAVCAVSTGRDNGNEYYETVGHAYGRLLSALLDYDHRPSPEDWAYQTNGKDFSDPNGVRFTCEVWDGHNGHACDAVCAFYRMPSGRYEFTVYLA